MKPTKTTFFLGCLIGGLGAALLPALLPTSKAETRLLPFQGRLTDAAGAAITDGTKVVEFKIYDAPAGGSVKWAGEVHKLSVNGGLVNTMLGSKASLGGVDFATPTFLQITIDSNDDGQITSADPPLLPRQSVIPSIYSSESGNARQLAGADWSAVIVDGSGAASNSPSTGFLKGSKIQPGSLTGSHLAPNAVASAAIADGAVTSAKLADGSIAAADLVAAVRESLVPPGTILPYGGSTAPAGFLLCNGASYPRAGTYAALYGAISTHFGTPSGTTFNVPDLRGQFLRGVDTQPEFAVAPSATNTSTNAITITAHGFNRSAFPVRISNTGGSLPAPLAADTTYYVILTSATSIKLATSEANALANTPVDLTSQGTGSHKIVSWMDPDKLNRGAMANGGSAGGAVGSIQSDLIGYHSHTANTATSSLNWAFANFYFRNTNKLMSGIDESLGNIAYYTTTAQAINGAGGSESRPRNAYVNYIIKY